MEVNQVNEVWTSSSLTEHFWTNSPVTWIFQKFYPGYDMFRPISFHLEVLEHLKDMMTKISPGDTNDHQVNLHHLHARSKGQDLSWTRFEFLINENQFRNSTFYLYVKSYHTYSIFSLNWTLSYSMLYWIAPICRRPVEITDIRLFAQQKTGKFKKILYFQRYSFQNTSKRMKRTEIRLYFRITKLKINWNDFVSEIENLEGLLKERFNDFWFHGPVPSGPVPCGFDKRPSLIVQSRVKIGKSTCDGIRSMISLT